MEVASAATVEVHLLAPDCTHDASPSLSVARQVLPATLNHKAVARLTIKKSCKIGVNEFKMKDILHFFNHVLVTLLVSHVHLCLQWMSLIVAVIALDKIMYYKKS